MATYLYAWNPAIWGWPELSSDIRKLARRGQLDIRWSCGRHRHIEPGSRAFLVRLGQPPKGIFGSGVTLSAPETGRHWIPEKAAAGIPNNYVDLRLDHLHPLPLITFDELVEAPFRRFRWGVRSSGTYLPEPIADALEDLWASRLAAATVPRDGPKPRPAKPQAAAEAVTKSAPGSAARSAPLAIESGAPATARVGSHRIRYLSLGTGPDPLVMIHGFGGDLDTWMLNREVLASRRRVVAMDLPGHGYSDKHLVDGSLAEYADSVLGLLAALGIDRAHLVGHSMGGAIALAIAQQAPARVRSLSLLAPAGLGREANASFLNEFATACNRTALKPLLQMLFANPEIVTPEIVEIVLRYKRRQGVTEALQKTIAAQFPGGRQKTLLREVVGTVPTQVFWGEADRIIPPRHVEGLPPSVKVHRLPGVGHVAHLEAAEPVNRLVDAFVDGMA